MKKIANLDSLLSANNLNDSIIELDNFVSTLCSWGDEPEALNETQRTFYYNQNLEREVNNGGFKLYFMNSSGEFAHETVQSLKAIGAKHTAFILQSAIDEFPGKQVPRNRVERIRTIEGIENRTRGKWSELEQLFAEYKDDLNLLNIEFIRNHRTDF
jgi:hypothetical protein